MEHGLLNSLLIYRFSSLPELDVCDTILRKTVGSHVITMFYNDPGLCRLLYPTLRSLDIDNVNRLIYLFFPPQELNFVMGVGGGSRF